MWLFLSWSRSRYEGDTHQTPLLFPALRMHCHAEKVPTATQDCCQEELGCSGPGYQHCRFLFNFAANLSCMCFLQQITAGVILKQIIRNNFYSIAMFHSTCNSSEVCSTIVQKAPLLGKCYTERKAKNLFVKDLIGFLFGLDHPLKI